MFNGLDEPQSGHAEHIALPPNETKEFESLSANVKTNSIELIGPIAMDNKLGSNQLWKRVEDLRNYVSARNGLEEPDFCFSNWQSESGISASAERSDFGDWDSWGDWNAIGPILE